MRADFVEICSYGPSELIYLCDRVILGLLQKRLWAPSILRRLDTGEPPMLILLLATLESEDDRCKFSAVVVSLHLYFIHLNGSPPQLIQILPSRM